MPPVNLPTGTITFLFTDIQGSTQLWQQFPEDMPAALSRHHAILRQTIEENNGYVFQIIGDAFCAAFQTATDGLLAAVEAQRRLHAEVWGETGTIMVRMALHSGTADVQAGDYTSGEYRSGLTLSRAARLLSAGHGGQVLLSRPAVELLGDHLPGGVELRDLGPRRLKDLMVPEHIFQSITPDLPNEFPPLKTLDSRQHNLPAQLTSFIGRAGEMAEVKEILLRAGPAARLLTLSGPGGSGKTRLALQVAADLIDEFPDGAWFVDLSPLTDSELVAPAVAAAFGLREQPWRKIDEVLVDFTRAKKLLLVIDNCEHLVEACAQLSHELLQAGEKVKILATSREPLDIPGEVIYRVPVLSLPDPRKPIDHEALIQFEAVRLFVERAAAARQDFTLNQANAQAVAYICQRLDGIPLAIELAAARLRAFSVEQIAERLEDRFRLLTGGSRTNLPRQQTLRALIDWSNNLLTDDERWLFQRLAVFQGGWTLEAAQAICSGNGVDEWDVLDLLARLVDRSLVVAEQPEGIQRYRMLETIRQYAAQALQASDQQSYWQGRHLKYYLNLVEEAAPRLRSEFDIVWIERLESEYDNLRTAFDSAIDDLNPRDALRLCGGLDYFWYRRGHIQEAMHQMQQAVSMPGAEQFPLQLATALQGLGLVYWLNGAYHTALDTLDHSIDLAQPLGAPGRFDLGMAIFYRSVTQMRLGDFTSAQQDAEWSRQVFQEIQNAYGLASAYYGLGRISIEQGKFEAAQADMDLALHWSRIAGDRLVISLVLNSLALLAISRGDFQAAQAFNQESLEVARQMKDIWMVSGALREAGNLALALGDYPDAVDYYTQSGEISRQQGLLNDLARINFNLGYVAVLQGDLSAGQAHLNESLGLFHQLGNLRGQTECLDGYAALAAGNGHYELAARVLGAADASFQSLGAGRWPVDLLEYQKLRRRLEEQLGGEAFAAQHASGLALSLDQATQLFI